MEKQEKAPEVKTQKNQLIIRKSPAALAVKMVIGQGIVLAAFLAGAIVLLAVSYLAKQAILTAGVAIFLIIVLELLYAGYISYLFIRWFQNFYILTNNSIVFKKGSTPQRDFTFSKTEIEKINVEQDSLGEKFSYGTIVIERKDKEPLHLYNIPDPERYYKIIIGEKLPEQNKTDNQKQKDKDREQPKSEKPPKQKGSKTKPEPSRQESSINKTEETATKSNDDDQGEITIRI